MRPPKIGRTRGRRATSAARPRARRRPRPVGLSQTRTGPCLRIVSHSRRACRSPLELAEDSQRPRAQAEAPCPWRLQGSALRGRPDRPGRVLVPPICPELPGHRGDAAGARPGGRPLNHQSLDAHLHPGDRVPPAPVPQAASRAKRLSRGGLAPSDLISKQAWNISWRMLRRTGRLPRRPEGDDAFRVIVEHDGSPAFVLKRNRQRFGSM